MMKLVAILFLFTAAKSKAQFCKTKNVIPNLNGTWICNGTWLTDVVPTPMKSVNLKLVNDGDDTTTSQFFALPGIPGISTSRSFVYKMPKYYVVRGVKIDAGSNGMKNAKLYYWNDTTFDDYNRTNKRWHGIAIEDSNKNGIIEFSGFSRLSKYWKIVLPNKKTISVKNIAFHIIARITSGSDLANDYDISFKSELGQEIEPKQLDPAFLANVDAAPTSNECNHVRRPPADIVRRHRLDTNFYTKYTQAYGVPILANYVVDDRALKRACYTVRFMLSDNKAIRDHMYYNKGRVTIIGRHQQVPWTPEYRHLRGWTHRAAGGTYEIPVTVGAEENVLCERADPFGPAQDILMHEFAHGVQLIAARTAIPDFTSRLQRNWLRARGQGKWRNTYANTNNIEYFAECTQVFFNQQRLGPAGGDGIQNDINTREKLYRYDPGMYKLVQEIYPCASTDYIHRCEDKDQTRGVNQQFKMNCSPGGGGGTGGGGCQDKQANCQYWKEQGHCAGGEWVAYMAENCPKSCDKCTKTTTVKPTTVKPTTGGCEDTKDNCGYWLGEGYCTSEEWGEWMADNCPKSCGKCDKVTTTTKIITPPITTTKPNPVECEDLKENCAYWKGEGHCDSEEWGQYMKENCPVSCDKCTTTTVKPTTTEIATPPPITSTKPDPVDCEDTEDNCNYWLGEGYCTSEEWGKWMARNCPKSCGKCDKVTTTTEITTPPPITTTKPNPVECKDLKENCAYWEGEGHCDSDAWGQYMTENCPVSCNKCDTVTKTTTVATTTTPTTTVSTTTTKPSECVDVEKDCYAYLNQGYCTSGEYVDWMAENCAKSCDKCGGTTTELLTPPPLTTTTVVTTTSVTPPPNTTTRPTTRRQCEDNDASCVHWKIYCSSNQYVRNNCKNTCDSC